MLQTEIGGIGYIVKVDIDFTMNIESFYKKTDLISHPNPIKDGVLTIRANRIIESPLISVYNLMGQKLFENKYLSNDIFQIQLEYIQKGAYFLRVIEKNNFILNPILIIID